MKQKTVARLVRILYAAECDRPGLACGGRDVTGRDLDAVYDDLESLGLLYGEVSEAEIGFYRDGAWDENETE
jgi:hypothetical protein